LFWLSGERRERIEPYVREVEWVDGRPVISGFGQVLKSGLFGRDAMVDMKDRNLVAAGVVAGLAAICCATPVVVAAIGAAGLTAWLAKAGNVLVPALCRVDRIWLVPQATSRAIEDGRLRRHCHRHRHRRASGFLTRPARWPLGGDDRPSSLRRDLRAARLRSQVQTGSGCQT
jgi:hypothetical protein